MSEDRESEDALVRTAQLGIEANQFLHGRVGKYLISRAEMQIDEARLELDDADPSDPDAIRALQFKIHVAKNVGIWLEEVITQGVLAEQQIEEEDADQGGD